MVSKREIGLTLVGLVVGLIVIWIIRIGISINLFWGVLLVTTGAIIGFVIEWVIDEAYRRDPSRRQRLIEPKALPLTETATVPIATPEAPLSPKAAETLAHILQQRDEEMHTLRDELTKIGDELDVLRNDYEVYQRTHPDDLTVIKGIGAVYQRKLRDLGVGSYKQLAAADPERLRRLLDIKHWQKVDIESWIEQARDWAKQT